MLNILLIGLTLPILHTYAMEQSIYSEKLTPLIKNENTDIENISQDNIGPYFDLLPPEILVKIVAHCCPEAKNTLAYTNRYFNDFASKNNDLLILNQSPILINPKDQTYYLEICIDKNKVRIFRNLLRNGVNPNTIMPSGSSLLYVAIARLNTKIAKLLVEETDVDVNYRNIYRNDAAPLYVAAQEGCLEVVQALLNHKKIDTTFTFREGFSPCYVAAQRGNTAIVKLFIDHDETFLNKACINGSTPLYITAQEGKTETIMFLLSCNGINVNSIFRRGFTPLYVAARNGHAQAVKLLLDYPDVLINARDEDGSTALYIAAQNGHDKVIALLLADSRIEAYLTFLNGYSPLYVAAQNGHTRVVKTLLTHPDTQINALAPNGGNALYVAAQNGYTEIVKLLLTAGANAHQTNADGCIALHIASRKNHTDIVKLFIAHDEKLVNMKSNSEELTPLHIACENAAYDAVCALLASPQININALGRNGETPLDLALEKNDMQIADLLTINGGLQKKNQCIVPMNVALNNQRDNSRRNKNQCTIS